MLISLETKRILRAMLNKSIILFLITPLFLFQNSLAAAERGLQRINGMQRFALVIGNGNYSQLPKLQNPRNDAQDISRSLTKLGFSADLVLDADQQTMESKIVDFGKKLSAGGVGLFYYAGHGIQSKGRNYLIPANANLRSEKDLRYKTVDVGQVLSEMENANNGFNIVILDACRNNPLASQFRSASRGLSRINAPRGTFVAFATGPGMAAEDGQGRNGTFTKYFLSALKISNIPIEQTFKMVLKNVDLETHGRQTPWVSSSFTGDFYFNSSGASTNTSSKVAKPLNQVSALSTNQAIKPAQVALVTKAPIQHKSSNKQLSKYNFDGEWQGNYECGASNSGKHGWTRPVTIKLNAHKITEYITDLSQEKQKRVRKLHKAFPENYFISETLMRSPARGEISASGLFEIKYDFIYSNSVYDVYLKGGYDGGKFVLNGRQGSRDCKMTLNRKAP